MAPYLHEIWNLINFRINVGYFEAKAQIFKDCFQYMDMVVCIFIVYECLNFSSVYLKTPVATLNRNICPSSAIVSWHEMCFTGSRHISLILEQDLSSSSTWSMASLLLQSQWLMWCVTVSFPAPVIEKIKCTGTNILCTLHFGWVCLNCLDGSGLEFWFRKTCENVRSDLWNRFKLQIAVGHLFGQLIFSDWTVKWSILKRFKMYINLANMCTFKKDLKCKKVIFFTLVLLHEKGSLSEHQKSLQQLIQILN